MDAGRVGGSAARIVERPEVVDDLVVVPHADVIGPLEQPLEPGVGPGVPPVRPVGRKVGSRPEVARDLRVAVETRCRTGVVRVDAVAEADEDFRLPGPDGLHDRQPLGGIAAGVLPVEIATEGEPERRHRGVVGRGAEGSLYRRPV